MIAFAYYPIYLLTFWYRSVIGGVLRFFIEFNRYTASLLSVSLLFKTFFKPLKNEYRDGLVLFSIVFGMGVKTLLLSISIMILFIILLIEILMLLLLIVMPVIFIILLVTGSTFLQ